MDVRLAWVIGLVTMLAVFIYFYHVKHSLRYAFIVSLLWGKVLAGVYWVLGLDYPLRTIYIYRDGLLYKLGTLTANELIILLFLSSNLLAIAWPEIQKELGLKGLDVLGR